MGNAGWFHGAGGLHQIVGNTIRPFGYVEVGDVLATFAKTRFADVVIRVLDLCEALGIDLERAMVLKTAYNEGRPHKHGKVY